MKEASSLLGKHLLFVTAHPDDETFLAAGLIDLNHKHKGTNSIFCATCGEKGKSHMSTVCTTSELKAIRRQELIRVSRFLKVNKLFCLNLPDGNLKAHKLELLRRVYKVALLLKPSVIVSFGKDGVSGHMDHIIVGEAAKKTAGKLKIPLVAFVAPPLYVKHFEKIGKIRRKYGVYHKNILHAKYNIYFKIDPELKRKALIFHKSQIGKGGPFHQMPKAVGKQWLNYEYFVK